MHSRKPHLLKVLLLCCLHKQVLTKKSATLINGNRVANDFQAGILRGEWEAHRVIDPSHGTHCVPYAHKMDWALDGECLLKFTRYFEVLIRELAFPDEADCIGNQPFVAFRQQPQAVQHTAQSSRGIRAPAKSENINPVAGLVRAHQELVSICNVVRQAVAEGLADQICPPFPHSGERTLCPHCSNAGMVIGDLAGALLQHPVKFDHVGVCRTKLIACSITADHNIFWHGWRLLGLDHGDLHCGRGSFYLLCAENLANVTSKSSCSRNHSSASHLFSAQLPYLCVLQMRTNFSHAEGFQFGREDLCWRSSSFFLSCGPWV